MIKRSLATTSARRGRGENAGSEAIAASRTPPRTPGPAELGETKNAPPSASHRGLVRRPGFSAPAMDHERARPPRFFNQEYRPLSMIRGGAMIARLRPVAPPVSLAALAGAVGTFLVIGGHSWIASPFLLGVAIMVADTRARFAEYRELRDALEQAPRPECCARLRHMRSTWCQRHAAMTAAKDAGLGTWVRDIYRAWGYRWWHLAPDGFFSTDSVLFEKKFWLSLIGIKPSVERSSRARRASDRDQGEGREAETAKKVQGIDAAIERDIHAQGSKHMSQKPLALAFDGDVMLVAAATASSPHGVRKCFGAPNGPF